MTTQISSDASYAIDYAYNNIGTLDTLTYPTSTSGYRLKLQYEYENGLLKRVKDFNAPSTVFWQANETHAWGDVFKAHLGNGIDIEHGRDAVTGMTTYIQSYILGGATVQNLSYSWDKVGNLIERVDNRQTLIEHFNYDNLHRLTSSTGPDPITLTYDALGNIQTKTGIAGTYSYHATKKHAVTAAGSYSFAYDANGNVSTRNGSTISWYSYNLPNTISASGSNSSQFFYAPDRSRWKQVASYGGTSETTIYIGGLIEKVTLGAVTSWKHYIAGGSGTVALYTRKSSGAHEMHYLTRDHLGSVDSVTNGSGAVEVRLSYGAFGQRRKEAGWSGNPTSGDWTEITDSTRRGFTAHEMLDNLNLTHMNGRVYDQIVGRFISADPFIPEPGLTQSFNRYSYVRNNPLKFTDPNGFCPNNECQILAWVNWREVASIFGNFAPLEGRMAIEERRWPDTWANAQPFPTGDTPSGEPPGQDPIDEVANQSITHVPTDFLPGGQRENGNTSTPFSDFFLGTLIGTVNDLMQLGHAMGRAEMMQYAAFRSDEQNSAIESLPVPQLECVDSNIGQLGCDSATATVGAATGIVGGLRAVGGRLIARGAAKSATQTVVRTTRSGERAVRITRSDGSVIDISPQRVKEYVPNTHPNAPPGTLDRVRFPNGQPGSKGLKRDPTPEELELLRNLP